MSTDNMKIKDLKRIIADLPDDMDVIITVIAEDDSNNINGFRHVRRAGVVTDQLVNENAFLLNGAWLGLPTGEGDCIENQLIYSGYDDSVICTEELF